MADAKHTPGPWDVRPDEESHGYFRIRGTRLGFMFKIANVLFSSSFDREEAREAAAAACPQRWWHLATFLR